MDLGQAIFFLIGFPVFMIAIFMFVDFLLSIGERH